MKITVKVIPNAHKNAVEGFSDGVLKVRINAPPDKGKANDALIELLSIHFSVPKSRIHILSGKTSRIKKIEITDNNHQK
jgi:uncharacterized protein